MVMGSKKLLESFSKSQINLLDMYTSEEERSYFYLDNPDLSDFEMCESILCLILTEHGFDGELGESVNSIGSQVEMMISIVDAKKRNG